MVTIESRQATADRIFRQCKDLLVSKGKAYNPGTTDANRNFKKIGEMLGIDPRVVWCVYFLKQVDAFVSIMLGGSDGGEPLESRAVDICNYAVIGVDVDSEPKPLCREWDMTEGILDQLDKAYSDVGETIPDEEHGAIPAAGVSGIGIDPKGTQL